MSLAYSNVGRVVGTLIRTGAYSATKYVSPKYTVKATRRYKLDHRASHVEFLVTLGVPNVVARNFIKQAIKAKEPFPIKKVQLKFKEHK